MPKRKLWFDESFWPLVEKSERGCWIWNGARRGGRHNQYGNWRGKMAHRVSWEHANGKPIPEGMMVCHTCDTPLCVRPDHLFIGTASDNARDMYIKGRSPRANMTMDMARLIRWLHWVRGQKQSRIADSLGLSRSQVCEIVNGKVWKDVIATGH